MMRAGEVVRRGAEYLERHEVQSPLATAELLMMHVLETGRTGIYLHEGGLTSAEARTYGRLLCRRCSGTPAQHLTGRQAFRHLEVAVRPGVFVPRPETEIVVEVTLRLMTGAVSPIVVDVGTGTGVIALAIKAERPDARVFATDHARDAVALARVNAAELGLNVDVIEGDLLCGLPAELRPRVDVVVSNPPYVPADELARLPPDARADPTEALVGGPEVYARLLPEAFGWLARAGRMIVEIGERQADDVSEIAVRAGFDHVQVHLDLAGRDRVISARRP
jgi:release factor glutamine methyltransferase